MKHQDAEAFVIAVPVQMTRREKLTRWAELVRKVDTGLVLYHAIEHMRPYQLKEIRPFQGPMSAFTMAVKDPTFQSQGLKIESTLVEIMNFFELSQGELHEFSCDCGGYIDNHEQAHRIDRLAG
jgi:hypothetical protein